MAIGTRSRSCSRSRGLLLAFVLAVFLAPSPASAVNSEPYVRPARGGFCRIHAVPGADEGCDAQFPFCYHEASMPVHQQGDGNACALCVDDQGGAVRDSGCSTEEPFCRDMKPGGSVPDENDGDSGVGAFCSGCYDNRYDAVDAGCTAAKPFCLGAPPTSPDGSGIVGSECGECDPSISHGAPGDPALGCTDEKPFCLYTSNAHNEMSLRKPRCFACVDDQDGAAVDYGCSADAPLCVIDFHPLDAVGREMEEGYGSACAGVLVTGPTKAAAFARQARALIENGIGGGQDRDTADGDLVQTQQLTVASCTDDMVQDNATLGEIDSGCSSLYPYCIDTLEAPGSLMTGTVCDDVPYPTCDFPTAGDGSVATVPASCITPYAVNTFIKVALQRCNDLQLSVNQLIDLIKVEFLPEILSCSFGTTVSPSSITSRRHLLQLLTPREFILEVKVYVDSFAQGQAVLDVIESGAFLTWLSVQVGAFATISQVVDLQAVFLILGIGTSDPHFTTLAGDKFDFNGVAGSSYCIVTDRQLQINAHFLGAAEGNTLVGTSQPDTRTWMDQVAIMHGTDRVLVDAWAGAGATYATSFGTVVVNGEVLPGRSAMRKLPSGITVARQKTRITVAVPGVAVVVVEVVRASFWEAGAGPGRNFLNLQVKQFNATSAVHGVLGQSFAPDAKVLTPEGNAVDYATTGIFATDCHFNQFTNAQREA